MVVAYGVAVGLLIGWLRGGNLAGLRHLRLRLPWVILLAAPLQLLVIYDPWRIITDPAPAGVVMLLSYIPITAFVMANRNVPGFRLITVGLAANLAVMLANGGLMPVAPESIRSAGHREGQELVIGSRATGGKGIILPIEQTRLAFLSDTIIVPMYPRPKLVSIGDIVAFGGLVWSVQMLMRRREPRDYPVPAKVPFPLLKTPK